jgi:hypothetical protein
VAQLIVLLHAPALGPGSWLPVARELSGAGEAVVVPSLAGFDAGGRPYAPRLVRLAADQVRAPAAAGGPPDSPGTPDRVVLVTHSGAGVFAPHVLAAIAARDAVSVFADAALPGPAGAGPVVDDEFLPFLRRRASGGVVPPWPQWWPGEDLSPLFPDEATERMVAGQARPLPLAFFEETLPPVPERWRCCPAAYLAFSAGYRQQAGAAADRGWPVRELPGEHLHMLIRPAEVAAAITSLAAEARRQGSSPA